MNEYTLDRRQLVAALMKRCGDATVVTGLGSSTYDVAAAGDRDENFYLWGAMGGATMVALGMALAQPQRRVITVTGDAEALMGVGSFATIATQRPSNLAILILDNESFCETGGQVGLTGQGIDLEHMATAAGIGTTITVREESGLDDLFELLLEKSGPVVGVAKISLQEQPRVLPPREGAWLQHRFRRALGLTLLAG